MTYGNTLELTYHYFSIVLGLHWYIIVVSSKHYGSRGLVDMSNNTEEQYKK